MKEPLLRRARILMERVCVIAQVSENPGSAASPERGFQRRSARKGAPSATYQVMPSESTSFVPPECLVTGTT